MNTREIRNKMQGLLRTIKAEYEVEYENYEVQIASVSVGRKIREWLTRVAERGEVFPSPEDRRKKALEFWQYKIYRE